MTTRVRKRPLKQVAVRDEETAVEKRPRPGNAKYDWETIRREFIEGIARPDSKSGDDRWWPTLKELSEAHEVPYARMRKKSSEERWSNKRAAAEQVFHQKRAQGRAKLVARNALDFDDKTYSAARLGIAMVTTRLAEIASEVQIKKVRRDQAWQDYANGIAVDKTELYSAIRADELQSLANAAERLQTLGMKALGTDVQRVDVSGMGDTQVNILNVTQEVQRDDPERLAAIMGAMGEANMLPPELIEHLDTLKDDEVIDAEVEEDEGNEDGEVEDDDDGVVEDHLAGGEGVEGELSQEELEDLIEAGGPDAILQGDR